MKRKKVSKKNEKVSDLFLEKNEKRAEKVSEI